MAKNIVLFSQFQAQRETVVFHALKVVVVGSVFSRIETAVAQILFLFFIYQRKCFLGFLKCTAIRVYLEKAKQTEIMINANINNQFDISFQASISMNSKELSALIGVWKCNFPPLPTTDRPTNQPFNGRTKGFIGKLVWECVRE